MATYLGPYMGMRRSMEDYMGMGDYMGTGWTTIWWGRRLYGYGKTFMGRGGWATMKHGDSMGGPKGDNKTTGT